MPAKAGYISIIFILFFTILFNLPRFFELKTIVIPNCISYIYLVQPTELRLSPSYSSITMLSSVLFLNLIPSACLFFINKQIYTVVQQKIQIMETLNRRKVCFFSQLSAHLLTFLDILIEIQKCPHPSYFSDVTSPCLKFWCSLLSYSSCVTLSRYVSISMNSL